jgi:hypothetical protein
MSKVINYLKDKELLLQQLEIIHNYYACYSTPPDPLTFETILTECAKSWEVTEQDLLGKINPSKDVDMVRKTSLLYGIFFFTECRSDDAVFNTLGYGKIAVWRSARKVDMYLTYDYYSKKFEKPILTFIQRLIQLAPSRFEFYVNNAQERKTQQENAQKSTGPTLKDYIEQLEKRAKFASDMCDFYRDLYMKELNRPNRTSPYLGQPLIGPAVTNFMQILWQTDDVPQGAYADRLDPNTVYEFVDVEKDYIVTCNNLDEWLKKINDYKRN